MHIKPIEDACVDCPSRPMLNDIAALMRHINKAHPEASQQIQADGMSPMFGAVLVMKALALRLAETETELEELKATQVPGVNCNESA